MQFLRRYGKEHEVLMLPLHGDDMISGDVQQELSELLRIGGNVKYLIDSERSAEGKPLRRKRQDFVELCTELNIGGLVLKRRALENYFTETAASSEMRASPLTGYLQHLAGLGAQHAVSAAFEDNAASLGVSRKLGYRDDGIDRHVVRGRPATTRRLRLTRADWEAARTVPVRIDGLEPCLPHFGLPAAGTAAARP